MSTDLSNISPALEASGLSIGYRCGRKEGWKTVHPRVNFVLHCGELTSLIGLNGAGKSTLLRTLCGFQPAVSGTVRVLGRELSEYSSHELALTVGVVLTERTNAGGLTVRELVALGRQPHTGFFGRLGERDREVVSEAMSAVGIAHKADSYVSELSDGERQRTMIAKALAQECPVIVLDEPTAFLDLPGCGQPDRDHVAAARYGPQTGQGGAALHPRYRQCADILGPVAASALG